MEGGAMNGLVQGLTTGFQTVASDMLSAVGSIAPVAIPVLGGIAVITIGVKLFRKVAK